jgi:DNA-binding transcriptional LysR family regulator
MATILSLVARGVDVAILPRLTLAGGDARVAVRELPGRSRARDLYAVARASSVRRPAGALIIEALTAAAPSLPRPLPRRGATVSFTRSRSNTATAVM